MWSDRAEKEHNDGGINSLFQKYFGRKPDKGVFPECFNCGKTVYFKDTCKKSLSKDEMSKSMVAIAEAIIDS